MDKAKTYLVVTPTTKDEKRPPRASGEWISLSSKTNEVVKAVQSKILEVKRA